jgi:hypothetical protein
MKYRNTFLLFLSSKRYKRMVVLGISIVFALFLAVEFFSIAAQPNGENGKHDDAISQSAAQMLAEGKQTFRFDTFGTKSSGANGLKLHEAIAKLSPRQALGLKVLTGV